MSYIFVNQGVGVENFICILVTLLYQKYYF